MCKTFAIVMMSAIALASCSAQLSVETVEYRQDPRTNICMIVSQNTYGDSVSYVPCTPEVLREIQRAQRK